MTVLPETKRDSRRLPEGRGLWKAHVIKPRAIAAMLLCAGALLLGAVSVQAERVADIRNTKHNFSSTVIPVLPEGITRDAYATNESQICAFCHTPHGATLAPKTPIWNRKLSGATYIPYSSSSIDATDLGQPGGKSKLCLSCHDGTLALGSVNVLNRVEKPIIDFTGPGVGQDDKIPEGRGQHTGFTRRLGTDLTNDHPISFTFDSAQAARDGELYDPAMVSHLGTRTPGVKPTLPLEDNKVECVSCHDPHLRDTSGDNIKFLRVNRFQQQPPTDGVFNEKSDLLCLGCHNKAGWVGSAHAHPAVGNERYASAAAKIREFPKDLPVWQAACLNCHDPHTVQGSRRILREGTDGPTMVGADGARFKQGGNPAIEETCYACHSTDGGTLQGQGVKPGFEVPDIKTDFTTMARHMPISSRDQPAGRERHDIGTATEAQANGTQGGKDFVESPANMGKASRTNKKGEAGGLQNRHAECTDCHNPHRVTKNRIFNADTSIPDSEGTHNHTAAQIVNNPERHHTNIASGVLRGITGVQPGGWPSTEFGSEPTTFELKRGDPGVGGSTDVNAPYVTREYQVCMKCHSNYGFDKPAMLGSFAGGTPPGTNAMIQYTNQGMEYQSPDDHKGEGTSPTPSGAYKGPAAGQGYTVDFQSDNHRSWHPALKDTGRTIDVRRVDSPNIWREPFNAGVGIQTMYCTDCHGSTTAPGTVVPDGGEQGNVWGPHGSNSDFLLKGPWDDQTGENKQDHLCFKCHNYDYYGKKFPLGVIGDNQTLKSGFARNPNDASGFGCLNVQRVNLHTGHAQVVQNFRCTYCHIAVPHGWKNKNFLVNLNDVGLEAGLPPGTQMRNNTTARFYNGPYYNGSVLKVVNFRRSGEWTPQNCGSAGMPGNGARGISWMNGSGGETCSNLP